MVGPYDVIVVRSGFGGGITACRLAEAGKRVCVLERGRRFGRDDYSDRPEQAPDILWHEKANPRGMYDVRLMRDVTVITTAAVGGGSPVFANVQLHAPADVFERDWPAAITADVLDQWYAKTEDALQPRTTPPDPALPKVRAFAPAGARAGCEANLLPIGVHFGKPREHPFSGVPQEGCQNLARCDIGCPMFARNTVDISPLSTFTTVHPLGGCPMGGDPARGVVDDAGRVHGVPGLRVLDGSIVPTALGVNPSKAIAALAERGEATLVEEPA